MVTPVVTCEAVAHLKAPFGLSERRACQIAEADRKTIRYQSRRATDTALRGRLRDLANERRRFGYRRPFVLPRREGEPSGINRISMDGKGRCLDNIFIERLWRSLKYECVYLHPWETGSQAKAGIGRWISFCNHQRPHAAHGGQPPAMVYFNHIETDQRGRQ